MMPDQAEQVTHTAPLWRWSGGGNASWFFVTIDGEAAEAIAGTALMRRLEGGGSRGFGSVKVTAEVGSSRWQTSIFPQKGEGYLLPMKAVIRKAEGLSEGDVVSVTLTF
jgi:hypothetical protein